MAKKLILDLPFPYYAEVKPPLKQGVDHVGLRGRLVAEVTSVSGGEAPTVLSVSRLDRMNGCEFDFQYRSWNGRLFAPLGGLGGMPIERFVSMGEEVFRDARLITALDDRRNFPRMPGRARHGTCPVHPRRLPTDREYAERVLAEAGRGNVRWKGHDREAAEAEALRIYTQELLVVDGQVWTSRDVAEPFWAVTVPQSARDEVRVELVAPREPFFPIDFSFPFDRCRDAVEFAKREKPRGTRVADPRGSVRQIGPFSKLRDEVVETAVPMLMGLLKQKRCTAVPELKEATHALETLGVHARWSGPLTRPEAERALRDAEALLTHQRFVERSLWVPVIRRAMSRIGFEDPVPAPVAEEDLEALSLAM